MENKTILITGASAGIGREVSRQLAARGHRLILVCRNERKGIETKEDIIRTTGNASVDIHVADLSSLGEVSNLADNIRRTYDRLDVVINNAAVFVTKFRTTADGHELQWGVNYLAPFLLTGLLLDTLRKSNWARIINISSEANYKGRIHYDDPGLSGNYNGLTAYRQSKLALVMFTFELAERLRNEKITVNCLHPGRVRTAIGYRNSNHWMALVWFAFTPWMKPVKDGAYAPVQLADDERFSEITGKFFYESCQERRANPDAYDAASRKKLWDLSEQAVGLHG